jgi:hypothetical protein
MKAILSWPVYQSLLDIYNYYYNPPGKQIDILHGDETNRNGQRMLSPKAMDLISLNFESDPSDIVKYNPITYIYNFACNTWMKGDNNYRGEKYNRYDWIFSGWVDYFMWRAESEHQDYFATDPNLFKAIAWKETQVGTGPENEGVAKLSSQEVSNLKGYVPYGNTYEMTWGLLDIQQPTDPIQNIAGLIRLLNGIYMSKYHAYYHNGQSADPEKLWEAAISDYGPHEGADDYLPSYGADVYNFYMTGTYKKYIYVFGTPPPGFNR